jgi:citrate synthase
MSQMTYIDGNKGKLLYRRIPVGYIFDNYDYEDVLHLLIWIAGEQASVSSKDSKGNDSRTIRWSDYQRLWP